MINSVTGNATPNNTKTLQYNADKAVLKASLEIKVIHLKIFCIINLSKLIFF